MHDTTRNYLNGFVTLLQTQLHNNLVGVYLHGSLAMGCYYPPKSDMDMLIVVYDRLDPETARALNVSIARYAEARPTLGNIECSVITLETARTVPEPMPYELHFSDMWAQRIVDDDVTYGVAQYDPDLPAHVTVVKQRGMCLYGQPIDEVFGDVPWRSFLAAILDDFDWIIEGENIIESPYYGVLNSCRVLQALQENNHQCLSKYEGAVWGMAKLPEAYAPLIQQALAVYTASEPISENQRKTGGVAWDTAALLAFRDYAVQIRNELTALEVAP